MKVKYFQADAGVRYWEDAAVNGVEDEEGDLIPCREGDYWKPKIELESGQIVNWTKGTTADIHYKVCDDGKYSLLDELGNEIVKKECYVPDIICPVGKGFGDYIIMHVDENGFIANWNPDLTKFLATKSFYED